MVQRPPEKPPANYWATIISVGSLAVAAMSFLSTTGKADRVEAQQNERRLCRLEVMLKSGECGR
jgi:hypothetical protein